MHSTRVVLVAGVAALLWAPSALANGGGYAFGVKFTGTLAPFQASGTEHVQIVDEKLDIALRRTDAAVAVRYTMRNLTSKPVTVQFGFPVEAQWEDNGIDDSEEPAKGRPEGFARAVQQLKGYAVTADGQPVASKLEVEPFATGKIPPFPGSEALKNVAGWMVSTVELPADKTITLEIRYSADYLGDSTFVSDDTTASPLSFVYRLSTGAIWNGPIASGTVTIRTDGIPWQEVEIEAPAGRFSRTTDGWSWSFKNLKPTLADDIRIVAVPGFFEQGIYLPQGARSCRPRSYVERKGQWGEGHQCFKARASSTLPPTKSHGFGPEHLAEYWPEAPWSEGAPGSGVGEWVELQLTKAAPLLAIEIFPGFISHKKKDLFTRNGRPSRVEVTLNGEHRFMATLPDKAEGQLVPVVGYAKPVSKVRITIQDVFAGTEFADACISQVVLYDRLTKQPEGHHAR